MELDTHPGLIITDPQITVVETTDFPLEGMFQPRVLLEGDNYKISHTLPKQPYVNGTWTDNTVNNAVTNYLNSL